MTTPAQLREAADIIDRYVTEVVQDNHDEDNSKVEKELHALATALAQEAERRDRSRP